MINGKRGQFFILIAILLTAFAATIPQNLPTGAAPVSTFEELHDNYVKDAKITINNAVYTDQNISQAMKDFTTNYMLYARTRDARFEVLYLVKENSTIYIDNRITQSVIVEGTELTHGSKRTISTQNPVDIKVGSTTYSLEINDEPIQFKAIFRKELPKQVSVYVEE